MVKGQKSKKIERLARSNLSPVLILVQSITVDYWRFHPCNHGTTRERSSMQVNAKRKIFR